MTSTQQVGFSQRIQLAWLEYTAQLALSGRTRVEANSALQELLQDKLSVGHEVKRGNREKAVTILLKIWLDPPRHLAPLRDEGLEHFQNETPRMHIALHWGMSMAAYPFFGAVASVIGKLLRLQDQIGTGQVQRRIREQLGERETVARAARRVYRSFIDWNILKESETRGEYCQQSPIQLTNPALTAWLFECVLQANGREWVPTSFLNGHAALFPFSIQTSAQEAIIGRSRIETLRHSFDEEMVKLRDGGHVDQDHL